jgi:hypothetical protein
MVNGNFPLALRQEIFAGWIAPGGVCCPLGKRLPNKQVIVLL